MQTIWLKAFVQIISFAEAPGFRFFVIYAIVPPCDTTDCIKVVIGVGLLHICATTSLTNLYLNYYCYITQPITYYSNGVADSPLLFFFPYVVKCLICNILSCFTIRMLYLGKVSCSISCCYYSWICFLKVALKNTV